MLNCRYLDSVLPDEFGVRQKPLFFLSKSYWGFSSINPEDRDRDLNTWLTNLSAQHALLSQPRTSKRHFITSFFHRKSKSQQKQHHLTSSPPILSTTSSLSSTSTLPPQIDTEP